MSPASRTAHTHATSSGAPLRKRGRPPRLSRDHIVASVLQQIERAPNEPVTIARVASEVGASPAALYRHFRNLDDLLDAVVSNVLSDIGPGIEGGATWEAALEGWMRELRSRLLRVPVILTLIGRTGRTSPAWLDAASFLVEILERAGLDGDSLALTYLWILETTTGLVLQEAALPVAQQVANARASRADWSEAASARFAAASEAIDGIDGDRFFDFAVVQAVSAVDLQRKRAAADR